MHFKESAIKSIKYVGVKQTYDIEMPNTHSYIANGLVVHNSVGDAFGIPKYIAEQVRKKGFKACALTDHGTLAGLLNFQRAMNENNIKPILGCEFYIVGDEVDEKGAPKNKNHLLVLAKNKQGWNNILELHNIAVDNFYYRPRLPLKKLFEHKEGLIVSTACMQGVPNKFLSNKEEIKAREFLQKMKREFGEDFYIEMMPHNIEDNQEVLQKLYGLGKELGIKAIITTDAHYPNKDEIELHEAIKAIAFKKKYGEAGFNEDCFYIMTDDELAQQVEKSSNWMLKVLDELKQNTIEISDKISFQIELPEEGVDTLPIPKLELFKQEFPKTFDEFEIWKKEVELNPSMLILSNHPEVDEE